jgi:hypothetical protein
LIAMISLVSVTTSVFIDNLLQYCVMRYFLWQKIGNKS